MTTSPNLISRDLDLGRYDLNPYDPNIAAASIFLVAFHITAGWHTWQCHRSRSWYFLPLLISMFCQATGYVFRIDSALNMTSLPLYILSVLFILIAPILMAASIYVLLGRIIVFVHAEHHSLIRISRLTKTFVWADIFAFNFVSTGGGFLPSENRSLAKIGRYLIIVGLFLQIIFFSIFVFVAITFNIRIVKKPTPQSKRMLQKPFGRYSWLTLLRVVYASSALIMIRSIYRTVEYIQGDRGYLAVHEVYFYCFDALMMIIASILFNIVHPAQIMPPGQDAESGSQVALEPVEQSQRASPV